MKLNEFSKNGQVRKVLAYSDSGTPVTIASLPVGTDVCVNVTVDEVFDATAKVSIGTNLTANKFIADFTVVALGGKTSEIRFTTTETERDIVANIAPAASVGGLTIKVDYVLPTSQEVSY